jgi:RNA polymerase sigma-70 factor (ECF subfamily)
MPYEEAAAALDMSEGAVKVAVHRLRRRCREVLRAEIAQTVAGPEEVEEELRDLFHAVSR